MAADASEGAGCGQFLLRRRRRKTRKKNPSCLRKDCF